MFGDLSSFKEAKLSMEHYREWAGEIANSYLNEPHVVPTDTLCKIAQSEELTPHQISLLASEANKMIHGIKYAASKEKYFAADFPLADSKLAISRLQVDGGSVKIASVSAEPVFKKEEMDPFKAFGVEPEVMDKTASIRGQLKYAGEKVALLCQKLSDKITLTKYASQAAERRFIKQARQFVLAGDNSAERMKHLGTLDHFVKESGMKFARPVLAKVAAVLGAEGLLENKHARSAINYFTKKADNQAPAELISDFLPAKIVNGQHPLYITLKTLRDKNAELFKSQERYQTINDRLSIIGQKVRAL